LDQVRAPSSIEASPSTSILFDWLGEIADMPVGYFRYERIADDQLRSSELGRGFDDFFLRPKPATSLLIARSCSKILIFSVKLSRASALRLCLFM
jgi:hypothetical protein